MAIFRIGITHAHHKQILVQQKRFQSSSLFIAGHAWTGAFGTGPQTMLSTETSTVSPEDRENSFTNIVNEGMGMNISGDMDLGQMKIVNAAAGWGHTILQCQNGTKGEIKTFAAGRPYDFQALLRLNRLPSFIRRAAVSLSLQLDEEADMGFWGNKIAETYLSLDDLPTFQKSVLPYFKEIKLPNGDVPLLGSNNNQTLAASAGLTALIGESGKVYTFGLNKCGQCGVGDKESVHIWHPLPIRLTGGDDDTKFTDVALGLQHGLVLDENGHVYAFGKSSRGQLGAMDDTNSLALESKVDFQCSPVKVGHFEIRTDSKSPNDLSMGDSNVTKISAGFNHSAVVTKGNHAFVWGKNVALEPESHKAIDSSVPIHIRGLPENLKILDISCGSHHTSLLLEDGSVYATGITTDTKEQLGGDTTVQIIPPGLIDMPVRQFTSHFDRTTVVAGECGNQVLEVQLWSTEELRKEAVFEPSWVEEMFNQTDEITSVHRGWLHTVVIGGTDGATIIT